MKPLLWLLDAKHRFDLVAGLCDGILTALTLAAGRLLDSQAAMRPDLALRVAIAAGASGAFIFFVARYAALRGRLVEAERQLNLTGHGRMAATHLGRQVIQEAGGSAVINSLCGFCGALLPLLLGVVLPAVMLVVALAALAALGAFLAHTVHGRPLRWSAGLLAGGVALTFLGLHLKIV